MADNKNKSSIDENILVTPSKAKSFRLLFKNRLRYPFIKKRLQEFEPNVYFGYTDHPLDIEAVPFNSVFTFLRKFFRKKGNCILKVELREQKGNSFIFSARGYNIFQIRNFDVMFAHEYKITRKTGYCELTLQLDILRDDAYRLRLAKGDAVPANLTPMISGDIQNTKLRARLKKSDEKYTILTSKFNLDIYRENFRIEISDSRGNLITESGGKTKDEFPPAMDSFPLGFIKDRKFRQPFGVESFMLYPGEAVYGLGEQFGPLNKVGSTIGLWHFDGLGNTSGRTYKNIPFFMSTRGYGVFINESRPITLWIGSREYCKNQIAIEGDLIDYYFFYGPSFKSILYNYTELTGKSPVPPKWTFGTWISRISYSSQEQVLDTAKKLRDMKFPSDVIHIDTCWFEKDWRCDWQFDKKRFPNPVEMFEEARKMGFRISLWQTPYVMDETNLYREAKKKKVLAKNNAPFVFLFLYPAHPIDFSKPEAVSWYQERLKNLFDLGASVIKADFGEGIEPAMKFKEYNGRQMHNLYPLLYNKAAFEITEKVSGEGVIWARSAYAGSQRYPIHWSGDNSANHENLLCSLRGGLSLGLCGFTFWSQDTGGFVGTCSDELYIRWTQLSVFQSHIRFHGSPPRFREPWYYEPETQKIVRRYLNLRYQLIPYLYSEAQAAATQGLPVLSPMVIEFQNDPNVFNIEDQFMCGRNLLIAPVLTRNNTRRVYLAEGEWYDYWTGRKHTGGQWITVTSTIEIIPIFIRSGSILPLGPVAQCTDELTEEKLILKIYPDDRGRASYEMLDKGKCTKINAQLERNSLKISIRPEPSDIQVDIPRELKLSSIFINKNRI